MDVVFAQRDPTENEFQRFRLIFSTFQDGSGMLKPKKSYKWMERQNAITLPGWRDFERSVALGFSGRAIESKWIYDVTLSDPQDPTRLYGISCKMRRELRRVLKGDGRVTIELSNAAGGFWDTIRQKTGLTSETYSNDPAAVGVALVGLVEGWHSKVSMEHGGQVDSSRSAFLTLQYSETTGEYQLFQFPITLPDPRGIEWKVRGRALIGEDEQGRILEWYGSSGGQLKYYPLSDTATWRSDIFQLEPLPQDLEHIALNKAATYFPERWNNISRLPGRPS